MMKKNKRAVAWCTSRGVRRRQEASGGGGGSRRDIVAASEPVSLARRSLASLTRIALARRSLVARFVARSRRSSRRSLFARLVARLIARRIARLVARLVARFSLVHSSSLAADLIRLERDGSPRVLAARGGGAVLGGAGRL